MQWHKPVTVGRNGIALTSAAGRSGTGNSNRP
jgi:hypothetical protein